MTERQTRLALACCLGAGFATLLDSVVLSFAVPSMTETLGASTAQVQWLLASYSLTFGLGLVPGGRLGDAFGRRGLFVAGLAVFIVGGCTAAGATGVWWVVAGRVIQGFGAGLISAQVLGVIQDLFAGPRRVRALAAYTSAGAAAALVGPLAAAALLTWLPEEWAWRAVLLLNLPFALATLVLALRHLPAATRHGTRLDLDLPGVVLLGALAVLVTLPVIDPGAHALALVAIAVAVPALVALLVGWERRYSRRGKVPLVAPALVRQPGFLVGNGVALLWFGSVIAHGTVLTLYLIQGTGIPSLAVAQLLEPPLRAVTLGFAPAGFHGVAASFLQLTQRLSATFCVAVASGLLFWGADAAMTPRSFVVSLLFCAVLLALAAALACARWIHAPATVPADESPLDRSRMRDDSAQALA